ncbi:hypothetical protein [Parasitella parasitica]|uniref:Uncharacterized protein n=1 Tax=Parasitella parasitica TaxID=35722 RepID=A0A0B7NRA6_9FUNG|nr:hypothetical protein [Parasitella parasitica]
MPSAQATLLATSSNPLQSSSPSSTTHRIPRPRPASHLDDKWKESSSSSSKENGWKTSSSSNIKKNMESWKMSGRPSHAQLQHVNDPMFRRQSATPTMMGSNNSPWQPKPLPQEPSPPMATEPFNLVYPAENPPFHFNTPIQPPPVVNHNTTVAPAYHSYPPSTASYAINDAIYQSSNAEYPPAMINAVAAPYPPVAMNSNYQPPMSNLDYHNYHHQQSFEYPPYNNMFSLPPQQQQYHEQTIYSQASLPPSLTPVDLTDVPPPPISKDNNSQTTATKGDDKSKKKEKPEKKVRQITVQSINAEHRVWIDVLPAETGLSLAEKIHIIATFRTRKIVSITTTSGRKVPLDNRPVFGSWMDMENFEDGERWTVEWRENDRGVVDRFFAKVVQGKRKDHVTKEKD